jgi:hypothetical protein
MNNEPLCPLNSNSNSKLDIKSKNHLNDAHRLIGGEGWIPVLISVGIGLLGGMLIHHYTDTSTIHHSNSINQSNSLSKIHSQEIIQYPLETTFHSHPQSLQKQRQLYHWFHWFHS